MLGHRDTKQVGLFWQTVWFMCSINFESWRVAGWVSRDHATE